MERAYLEFTLQFKIITMNYLNIIVQYVLIIIFVLLALQVVYLFVFAVAGRLTSTTKYPGNNAPGRFAIYIPAYKEDAVIVDTALAALMLDYPTEKREIVVIADSLMPDTLNKLREMPIQVVVVHFDKSTKAKALNQALSATIGMYDYALILDADNVCANDFLYRMNDALNSGYKVVQAQRVAMNTETIFALLDAISEGINNHIFRKGHNALGLSSAIIGSGMALDFTLFKEIMPEITAVGGFDKEMELRLLKGRINFGYAEQAIVFDEKTSQKAVFENQRRRWLSAQVHYMKRYAADGLVQLFKGNFDFFDKVVQTLLLPRILLLGITPIMLFLSLFSDKSLSPVYWLLLVLTTYAAIIISIPVKYFTKRFFIAVINLPSAFFSIFKLLFNLKGANKTFIHTPHGNVR